MRCQPKGRAKWKGEALQVRLGNVQQGFPCLEALVFEPINVLRKTQFRQVRLKISRH